MKNLKSLRLSISITILLGLSAIIWTDAISLINDSYYNYIVGIIGYKVILRLMIFLLFALIVSIFYYRSLIGSIIKNKIKPSFSNNMNLIKIEKEKRIILELLANRAANETNTTKLFIQLAKGHLQDTTISKFEGYLEDSQATFHVAMTLLSKMNIKSSQYEKLKGLTGIIEKTAAYEQLITQFE